jgi:hypothetical protein
MNMERMATIGALFGKIQIEITCFHFHATQGAFEMIIVETFKERDKIEKSDDYQRGNLFPVDHILPYEDVHQRH